MLLQFSTCGFRVHPKKDSHEVAFFQGWLYVSQLKMVALEGLGFCLYTFFCLAICNVSGFAAGFVFSKNLWQLGALSSNRSFSWILTIFCFVSSPRYFLLMISLEVSFCMTVHRNNIIGT